MTQYLRTLDRKYGPIHAHVLSVNIQRNRSSRIREHRLISFYRLQQRCLNAVCQIGNQSLTALNECLGSTESAGIQLPLLTLRDHILWKENCLVVKKLKREAIKVQIFFNFVPPGLTIQASACAAFNLKRPFQFPLWSASSMQVLFCKNKPSAISINQQQREGSALARSAQPVFPQCLILVETMGNPIQVFNGYTTGLSTPCAINRSVSNTQGRYLFSV